MVPFHWLQVYYENIGQNSNRVKLDSCHRLRVFYDHEKWCEISSIDPQVNPYNFCMLL